MKFSWKNDGPPLTNQTFIAELENGYVRVNREGLVAHSPSEYWWNIELRRPSEDGLAITSISVPSDNARAARNMAEEYVLFWVGAG